MRETFEEIMAEWQELEKERLQVRVNISPNEIQKSWNRICMLLNNSLGVPVDGTHLCILQKVVAQGQKDLTYLYVV